MTQFHEAQPSLTDALHGTAGARVDARDDVQQPQMLFSFSSEGATPFSAFPFDNTRL